MAKKYFNRRRSSFFISTKCPHKESIDVIYIDPPYNTGNKDFMYNDSFVDVEDDRHSKWLTL